MGSATPSTLRRVWLGLRLVGRWLATPPGTPVARHAIDPPAFDVDAFLREVFDDHDDHDRDGHGGR